jgi:PAS domain S-box-containing protein
MQSSPDGTKDVDQLIAEVQDWQLLHTMAGRLIQVSSLADQLEVILETAIQIAGGDSGIISLYSPEHKFLHTFVSQGLTDQALEAVACVDIGKGACGLAFKERTRIVIADTQNDPRYSEYSQYALENGIHGVCSTPFFGTEGNPLGVLSTYCSKPKSLCDRELRFADICVAHAGLFVSRAYAENALISERVRSEQVLAAMSDGFIVMDRNFKVLQINAEALRIDGRSAGEILGLTHWEAWPGSETLELGTKYKSAMSTRNTVRFEQWYKHNNEDKCFAIAAHPYSDGLALFYTDVTAQRLTERAIRDSDKRFYQLANTIPQLAWIADRDGYIFWYNERWYQYTGTAFADMQGWKWQSVHHPDVLETVLERWTSCIKSGDPFEMTFPLRGADGIFRPFFTMVSPLRDDDGNITQWFGTNTDITSLAEADKRKDEFLAMLAHELRNPLSPISSAAQLFALPAISPERVQQASKVITRQVNHMTELIDDLLDVSRVRGGLITLQMEAIGVTSVLNSAIEQVRSLIDSRSQQLTVHVEPCIPPVLGDHTRLVQVLANLINNASKYSPQEGKISIAVRTFDSKIAIAVSDSGVGISANLLPRVFDLFAQAERTSDRSQGGLGLGLAIAKSIVELHGGSVTAQSDGLGAGSTFEIFIPALPGAGPLSSDDADVDISVLDRQLKITIVDDNADAAESLAGLLTAQGHEVTVRYSGISLLQSLGEISNQDVFILDIGLPKMDGYQLVAELLKLPACSNSRMIALTGYGQTQDEAMGKAAGFHEYFVKPIKFDELFSILAAISERASVR